MQFIVSKKEFIPPVIAPDIIETLGDDYEIWTYEDYERLPPLLVGVYSYSAIPKCLAPLSTQGLVKSGVFRLQREFVPGLYGNGVYVVVIDTGVNYAQEAFMTPEGKTKIAVLWDQNTDTVYSEDEINAAILSENPYESIPGDEDGHGTFVASVICGNDRPQDDFAGPAPTTITSQCNSGNLNRDLSWGFIASFAANMETPGKAAPAAPIPMFFKNCLLFIVIVVRLFLF
jgi:hypothetical protein